MVAKHKYLILAVVYANFIVLGMADGTFGIAWPYVRESMGQPLGQAGIVMIVGAFFYALASSRLGRLSKYLSLEKLDFIGTAVLAAGFLGKAFAPNFTVFVLMSVFTGIGTGLIDSSLNSFMVKSFSSRHLNWLHCFWGLGASISPIIMTQMILTLTWRAGYASIAAVQGTVAFIVLFVILKGAFKKVEKNQEESLHSNHNRQYLTKKRHIVIAVASFFLYSGIEHSIGFWISSILLESRGMVLEVVGMYPAVYFASIAGGRMVFGFFANKFSNSVIIRFGYSLAFAGIAILYLTGSILGMALIGLGFAPIFPCFMHATSSRFGPKILTRLVGYQIAAAGAGVAVLSPLVGQILDRISLEALFPIAMAAAVVGLLMNEVLERNVRKVNR
ncbi:MAG: MFS transporter [Treponema sp.]|nr:MFS transporter [Treponema sp.]